MANQSELPQKIREVVAEALCVNSGDLVPNCNECVYFNSVSQYPCNNPKIDQLLSKLSKPPYNVVALADDQTPPLPSVVRINYTLGQQIYRTATTDMIDDSWRKVKCRLDGTPVKEG